MILLGGCSFKGSEKAIREVMHKQQTAWNTGNIPAFMEGYWKSDKLVFIGKAGPKYGWETTLQNYLRSYPDTAAMGELTFELLSLQKINPCNVWVLGRWNLARAKDNPSGYFTLWFQKIKGEWKIIADHTS